MGSGGQAAIREFLKREGQFLLPMLELEAAEGSRVQVMGRATIEAVLDLSAEGVAGVKQFRSAPSRGKTTRCGMPASGHGFGTCRSGRCVWRATAQAPGRRGRWQVEVPAYAARGDRAPARIRMLEDGGGEHRKYGAHR